MVRDGDTITIDCTTRQIGPPHAVLDPPSSSASWALPRFFTWTPFPEFAPWQTPVDLVGVSDAELAQCRQEWTEPPPAATRGTLYKYMKVAGDPRMLGTRRPPGSQPTAPQPAGGEHRFRGLRDRHVRG